MPATMSPPKIDDWLACGRRALSEGDLKHARTLFDRVLAVSKRSEALHLKGVTLLQQRHVREAVAMMEQAVALEPRADYCCDLGTACYMLNDRNRSEAAYRQALSLDPQHIDAMYNLANLLRERKQTAEALSLYGALLERRAAT
jgi:tetratricopeptide (TPR) repeat protein